MCLFCGAEATRLCDFIYGVDTDAASDVRPHLKKLRVLPSPDGRFFQAYMNAYGHLLAGVELHSCDAPMCQGCTHTIGFIHLGGESDTVDRCPAHVGVHHTWMRYHLSAAEADEYRARIAAVWGRR